MRRFPWTTTALVVLATTPCAAAQTLKEHVSFQAHDLSVGCLAFSPDGKVLATGGSGTEKKTSRGQLELKLWDVASGKEIAAWEGERYRASALTFSPDGSTLAVAGDREVLLWDTTERKPRLTLNGTNYSANTLLFSTDGRAVAGGSYREAKVWDVATGKELHSLRQSGSAFSPDLKTVASSNYQDVDLWDVETGKERLSLLDHRGTANLVQFTPDGKTIVVGSRRRLDDDTYSSEVRLWDAVTGKPVATYALPVKELQSLAVSPDGKLLAVSGTQKSQGPSEVKLVDLATGRELASVPL
jgi:WD40 repeat protein